MRRLLAAAGAVVVLAVGGGSYFAGHHSGVDAGRRQGQATALAGVDPADLALVRQLAADRALPAAPVPSGAAGAAEVASVVEPGAAQTAAHAYLGWLDAHPDASQPGLLSRLAAARVALPVGATLTGLSGPAGGNDSDGRVQVVDRGDLACVDAILDQVSAGRCYAGGRREDTDNGDYTPKRYPPAYRAAE